MFSEMSVRDLLDALDTADKDIVRIRDDIKMHEEWLLEAHEDRRSFVRELERRGVEILYGP